MVTMPPNRIDRILICLLILAIQAANIKVADIQIFEIITALSLPYMLLRIRGFFPKEVLVLLLPILIFFFYTSFYAYLRLDFYPPGDFGLLKTPLVLSLMRLAQGSLILFACAYLWTTLKHEGGPSWAINAYLKIACTIAIASLLAFAVGKATGYLFPLVYDPSPGMPFNPMEAGRVKLRGLFNEGGPYGLSLTCAFAFLFLLKSSGRKIGYLIPILLALSFLAAQSKAGVACFLALGCVYFLVSISIKRLALFVVLFSAILAAFLFAEKSFLKGFADYYRLIEKVSARAITIDPTDGNVAFGRVAGFLIGPRIFIDNPVLGAGLGNYSLVRNNPAYLGPLPPVKGWDLPGLGILTVLIEGGLMGLSVLTGSYLAFYMCVKGRIRTRKIAPFFLVPLAVQTFGVQFYFAYHWVFLVLLTLFLMESAKPRGAPVPVAIPA